MSQPLRVISRTVAIGICILLCGSCGDVVRQGRGSSYLIIDVLTASSGGKTGSDSGNTLASDVVTKGAIFADNGFATFRLAMKNVTSPLDPTTNNEITINSYHVQYTRADGRNTPGVDVPYAFDGSVTGTVKPGTSLALNFVIVRAQAKLEAPLKALAGGGGSVIISTIAEVTFYGRDQAGNQVSVTGTISINFTDWADPD